MKYQPNDDPITVFSLDFSDEIAGIVRTGNENGGINPIFQITLMNPNYGKRKTPPRQIPLGDQAIQIAEHGYGCL